MTSKTTWQAAGWTIVALVWVAVASSCAGADEDGFAPGGALGAGGSGDGDWCDAPRPGCECFHEGQRVVCGKAMSEVAGQIVCGNGESVCSGGRWGECVINNTVTLSPGSQPQTLGKPKPCKNPCDPYCHTFEDDPSGLGDPDAGIAEVDGGLSLSGGKGLSNPSTCSGGTTGSCGHSICGAGGPLKKGCDEPPPPPAPPPPKITETYFADGFANNSKGWSLGPSWQIGKTKTSWCQWYFNPDPGSDTSPGNDNGVAGVVLGGCEPTTAHDWYWLTSPAIDTSSAIDKLTLSFRRKLNSYIRDLAVEVYDGGKWVQLWYSYYVYDKDWTQQAIDLTAYKGKQTRVRFGYRSYYYQYQSYGWIYQWIASYYASWKVAGWSVDDVTVTGVTLGQQPPPPPPPKYTSCVTKVCASLPGCCQKAWDASCVTEAEKLCPMSCVSSGGTCFSCFEDSADHDGDGYSFQNGDCLDCEQTVNPGAYEFAGNGLDDDCDGTIDNEPGACDAALPLAASDPFAYAKAIDLCPKADPNATGKNKKWGVLEAKLVQADRVSPSHQLGRGILSKFGSANKPQLGARMAVFSSGTARAPGDPGYVNPNGQYQSFNQGEQCSYPPGFPKNKSGCPTSGTTANDSSGLELVIRVPTNAKSFAYDFDFFSSEYPEWVCTAFNDHYVALLDSSYQPPNDPKNSKNISFDKNGDPVSVNVAFFTVPGCSSCTSAKLTGTGFDGNCSWWGKQICGGATDWLTTTAPVVPGEDITILLSTWDMGDHVWDSTALVDNWRWSQSPAKIQTGKKPPPPPPPEYQEGWFVRDYDASGVCQPGTTLVWGHWSWTTQTPSDSSVAFSVVSAATAKGLDTAAEDKLLISDPPGPKSLSGKPAVAKTGTPDTQKGSAVVDATLAAQGRPRNQPFLRVISHLIPSGDKKSAPILEKWNLQFDCLAAE